jgi:hypothetical protein
VHLQKRRRVKKILREGGGTGCSKGEKNRKNGGLLKVKTLCALLKMLMRSPSPGGNRVMSLTKPFLGGNTSGISGF